MTTPVPIFILMGTAGCGKSSAAEQMQHILHCQYIEGDTLHPQNNVDKMAAGHPLDDEDRLPWLHLINSRLIKEAEQVKDLAADNKSRVVIVTCSSLKKTYRDILRNVPEDLGTVVFVYLKGSRELLLQRIQARIGHFMPASMLDSQLNTLEEPNEADEKVIIASIVPTPDIEAAAIVQTAVQRGYLPRAALEADRKATTASMVPTPEIKATTIVQTAVQNGYLPKTASEAGL